MNFKLPSQFPKKDYPYMYARISAKRAKLFGEQDYENLLKMKPNGIAKKLGEGEYKNEIDKLGADYQGVQLVELALNRNLANTLSHISSIAPESLEIVVNTYLRKYDVMTVKRLLRWKKGGEKGEIKDLYTPISGYSTEELGELANKEFEEIVDSISFNSTVNYQEYLQGKQELNEIETALDKAYYDELELLAEEIQSKPFKRFIEEELEFENLRTALRLKKYDTESEQIREHLLNDLRSDVIEEVIETENFEKAMERVKDEYSIELERETLEELEHSLDTQRLQNALRMLHTEPLGITSILGYIVGKIAEVRNLRMLVRAKETDIQNRETIRRNLVIA